MERDSLSRQMDDTKTTSRKGDEMKKNVVRLNHRYVAHVCGSLTIIRPLSETGGGGWYAVNEITGREIRIEPQRLLYEVADAVDGVMEGDREQRAMDYAAGHLDRQAGEPSPGNVNRRKLEAYPDLLAGAYTTIASLRTRAVDFDKCAVEYSKVADDAQAAIAKPTAEVDLTELLAFTRKAEKWLRHRVQDFTKCAVEYRSVADDLDAGLATIPAATPLGNGQAAAIEAFAALVKAKETHSPDSPGKGDDDGTDGSSNAEERGGVVRAACGCDDEQPARLIGHRQGDDLL